MKYDSISLIYNPNSTGDAPSLAKQIQQQLKAKGVSAELMPTNHAGHAEELAYRLASQQTRPLIVSVSGDGGYHEVVNGAMRAKQQSSQARPIVCVAAAGNANDHRRVVGRADIISVITEHEPMSIDLIRLTIDSPKRQLSRFAHSYIGFGITPEVAVELNRHQLNRWRELLIVLRTFRHYRSFDIEHDGQRRSIDSLIFANINEMAKVIKLHHRPDLTDNRFEVVEFPHTGRLRLLGRLIQAALWGLKDQPSYSSYQFTAIQAQSVQSDGEIEQLEDGARIRIDSVPAAIDSLF